MPEGPFGGPRPFSEVDSTLFIRFKNEISEEDEDEVLDTLGSIADSLSKVSHPVSIIGGPSRDVVFMEWTGKRVSETDLKSYRKTMNGRRGLDSAKAEVQMLSVVIDRD